MSCMNRRFYLILSSQVLNLNYWQHTRKSIYSLICNVLIYCRRRLCVKTNRNMAVYIIKKDETFNI